MQTMFDKKLEQLKSDLVTQGDRVFELLLRTSECCFDRDREKAAEVVRGDEVIDRVDVEIERASIPLLAMGETDEHKIRFVLTIVKINNELERIADCAVNVAEVVVDAEPESEAEVPATFRVMANSALAELNADLARQVLRFDDTVDKFNEEISLDTERKVASGEVSVAVGFRIRTVARAFERIADHATNICEQVIYLESGRIVRHVPSGWTEPELPDS